MAVQLHLGHRLVSTICAGRTCARTTCASTISARRISRKLQCNLLHQLLNNMIAPRASLAPSTPAAILRLQIDHHITMQSIHCAQKPGLRANMLNIKMPIVALLHTLPQSPLRRIPIRQSIKDKSHRLVGSHQPLSRRINPNPHPRLIKKRAVPLCKILRINPAELRGC